MLKVRVMPCLLLRNWGLVKTVKFKDAAYVGDPINTLRIYNDKEVDEVIFLDITATPENKKPQFKLLNEIATECFMPFSYGGGVRDLDDVAALFTLGAEKVAINTYSHENPAFLTSIADRFGAQAVIASIDVKKSLFGRYEVWTAGGRKNTKKDPVEWAVEMQKRGAGEVLLTSIDRDGTFAGYDTDLIKRVASAIDVPLIASGGAGSIEDFFKAVSIGGASAVAAGSMVVYQGSHRAVLVNFPTHAELKKTFDAL